MPVGDEERNQPLDVRLLELLVPEDADRSLIAHELCRALDIDLEETLASCLEVFSRRRAMATERWAEIPDAVAIIETFVVGIACGYGLALDRAESRS